MNVISKEATANYYNVDFTAAFKVLPIMNLLAKHINNEELIKFRGSLSKEEREKYEYPWPDVQLPLSLEEAQDAMNTLLEIGFKTTIEHINPTKDMLKLRRN